jgi:TRAP-type C4-dicarboxylate transport system permease large subunit
VLPYIGILLVALMIITYVPGLSLWLVDLLAPR